MRRKRPAVQHKVTADVAGWTCELIVWELVVPVEMLPAAGAVLPVESPAGGSDGIGPGGDRGGVLALGTAQRGYGCRDAYADCPQMCVNRGQDLDR
jgi:hypothetical protein